jgi:glutathione S-transferase
MLKLSYLSLRARAEPIRMVLCYGNVPFENHIITMKDWPSKKNDKKIAPFGQLPSLELPNGEILAETGAIIRLAAKLANVFPLDIYDAAKADMIFELAVDMNMINPILNFFAVDTERWQTAHDDYFAKLPFHLKNLNELLDGKEFFGGSTPHHGDFAIFHVLFNSKAVQPECLDNFPAMNEYVERVRNLPAIAKYLRERPSEKENGTEGSFIQKFLAKK